MLEIRKISIEELNTLQIIAKETFIETYAPHNTPESLDDYLKSHFSAQKLSEELNHPESHFFLAEIKGETVGYLKVNLGSAQTELTDENALEIERIYVSQNHQGKKIGQALFTEAIEIAKESRVAFVWLGVWENNTNAIGFYERMNFEVFDTHAFMFGEVEQTDLMMKLTL